MSNTTSTTASADQQAIFVQMSALLTGFAADTIAPPLDPVDLAGTLFTAVNQNAGGPFAELLAQYDQLSAGKQVKDMSAAERHSIGSQLLGLDGHQQKPPLAATAQSIMRLWYLGYWYPIDGSGTAETVVSDQAYIRGLAWKSMQSHAMGYSTFTYGYWAEAPPPLTDFTGNPPPSADDAPATQGMAALQPALSAVGQGKGGRAPANLANQAHAADQQGDDS